MVILVCISGCVCRQNEQQDDIKRKKREASKRQSGIDSQRKTFMRHMQRIIDVSKFSYLHPFYCVVTSCVGYEGGGQGACKGGFCL
jgi:hypothetical protein